jgi:hypothetical protein
MIAPPRKRGGSAARPLTEDELAQAEVVKSALKSALQTRWPLQHTWGDESWKVLRSRSQDGERLRISIIWRDGPAEDEVVSLAESMAWPSGLPVVLCLRRRPTCNERSPPLHRIQNNNDE